MNLSDELRQKAEAGDAYARFDLGCHYLKLYYESQEAVGDQFFEEAVKQLRIVSDQGLSGSAFFHLADAYWWRGLKGGDSSDLSTAVFWLKKAAEVGSAVAAERLGDIHFLGECGVQVDYAVAAGWYEKAMQINPAYGSLRLGVCYDEGKGVVKNPFKAENCFKKCEYPSHYLGWNYLGTLNDCHNGHTDHPDYWYGYLIKSVEILGLVINTTLHNFYDRVDFGWRNATWPPDYDTGEFIHEAFRCSPGRMFYNSGLAHYCVGRHQQAVEAWMRSASHKFPRSEYSLGMAYMRGEGVEKDQVVGCGWLLKAAEQEMPQAQARIADAYLNGEGVGKSPAQAVSWYKRAAELGNAPAQLALARCHEAGIGSAVDMSLAFSFYQRAAGQGCPQALSKVSAFYESGCGSQQDLTEALAYARLALEFNQKAKDHLISLRDAFRCYFLLRQRQCPEEPIKGIDERCGALAVDERSYDLAVERLESKVSPSQITESQRRKFELGRLID